MIRAAVLSGLSEQMETVTYRGLRMLEADHAPQRWVHRPLGGPPSLFCSPYSLGARLLIHTQEALGEQTPRPGDRKGREMAVMDFTYRMLSLQLGWGH